MKNTNTHAKKEPREVRREATMDFLQIKARCSKVL